VSEVISSLAVLAVTIALLGGISAVALGSVRNAGGLLAANSQGAAKDYGVLLALVSVRSNASGAYAWIYDYGWVQGQLSAAYLDGGLVRWSSTCGGVIEPGRMCAVSFPPGEHGQVSITFGTKSLGFTI
jgi:hypothetical protein